MTKSSRSALSLATWATGLLLAASCSLAPATPPLPTAFPPSPTAPAATGTPPAPSTATAPSAAQIPGWSDYVNEQADFALQYPPEANLSGTESGAVRIDLPIAPGTNLGEKYLQIDVKPTSGSCTSPFAEGYAPDALHPQQVTINGILFEEVSGADAGAGNLYEFTAYSADHGSECVSLGFVLHSTNRLNYPTPPPEFDKQAESAVFGQILSTFHWLAP